MEPSQIKAYAENQVEVTSNRGEIASARQWENIAAAASQLVAIDARREAKKNGK